MSCSNRRFPALFAAAAVAALTAAMLSIPAGASAADRAADALSKPGAQAPAKPAVPLNTLTAHLVGHAHIDLGWLWRWEETTADIARYTFKGTLDAMDAVPGLTFAQSQAALYEAVEKEHPEIFKRIEAKIKEGTWVPVGGMWVEPDVNMPDGESFARQLLYGKRYFLDKFGYDVKVGWNPDSFGHNWQLPQILRKAGIDSYVFGRCAPAPDPTHLFWWEGLDGSRVLGYVPPGWYNISLRDGIAKTLQDARKNIDLKDFLLLYGAGDHGGGPRPTDLEAIRKFRQDPNGSRVMFDTPEAYFKSLGASTAALPVVRHELNFTFPGCYTTQVETKRNNRRLESLLLSAEKFSAVAAAGGFRDYYPEKDIDEAWKIVLRNQFHDMLDGSGIGPLYAEMAGFYAQARERGQRALDFSLETIANSIDTRGEGRPVVVFNDLPWARTEAAEAEISVPPTVGPGGTKPWTGALRLTDGGADIPAQVIGLRTDADGNAVVRVVFIAENVPSLGYRLYRLIPGDKAAAAAPSPAANSVLRASASSLENEFLKVELDPKTGWLRSVYDKTAGREALAGPGNVLEAIVDEPDSMAAWELGFKGPAGRLGENGVSIELIESGPVRAVVRIRSRFRDSVFEQDLMLYRGIPRLDCLARFDWRERNIMIKAAFPVAVKSPSARFEIPYGSIERPADGAEVPALRWIDVSEAGGTYGVSLLNDSRYGFDVKGGVMRMSVVRGATSPDPGADLGRHELLYSIVPHAGDWKKAGTTKRGMELGSPLIVRTAPVHGGTLPGVKSFLKVDPGNVILSAMKKEMGYAERGIVLRLYEIHGDKASARIEFPWKVRAEETDLIERPNGRSLGEGTVITVPMGPYEIRTIKVFRE